MQSFLKAAVRISMSASHLPRTDTCDDAKQHFDAVTGDPQRCARVNSALDWYHGNVRLHAAGLTWHRVIGKNMKQPVSEGQAKAHTAGLHTTLQVQFKQPLICKAES